VNRLYGAVIPGLEAAMRFRLFRQGALASNVANADTPGYRRVDVRFDAALERASEQLTRTHERHLGAGGPAGYRISQGPRGTRPDANGVDRDQEVLQMSRNAGAFQDAATVLARVYALRRMAATGELG
jgi:flagellar basal-body rod protein FlgB